MATKSTNRAGKGKRGKAAKRPSIAPRLTAAKKRAFLEAFAATGTVTHAAKAAGVDRSAPRRWAETDEAFRKAWDEAQEEASDSLEREARRRAIEGVEEPVVYQGQFTWVDDPKTGEKRPLTIRKHSDALLIFLLKGNRPAKFRDNATVALTGADGGPVKTEAKTEAIVAVQPDQLSDVLGVLAQAGVLVPAPAQDDGPSE